MVVRGPPHTQPGDRAHRARRTPQESHSKRVLSCLLPPLRPDSKGLPGTPSGDRTETGGKKGKWGRTLGEDFLPWVRLEQSLQGDLAVIAPTVEWLRVPGTRAA